LQWDDSDEGWAKAAQERALAASATTAHEPEALYKVTTRTKAVAKRKAR
jgi:hypothetical protein